MPESCSTETECRFGVEIEYDHSTSGLLQAKKSDQLALTHRSNFSWAGRVELLSHHYT